ncbi:HAL/PAL/TAL family ammonia-lyase [Seinonella peptonophila]|nr:aromatic amino acid ammonia-lyase [Seinonella peptonophila]
MKQKTIVLNGIDLTIQQVRQIAREQTYIEICPDALSKVKAARKIVDDMLQDDKTIYGLNRGVGGNKDIAIPKHKLPEFNLNLLLSHAVATGDPMSVEDVRAMMTVRLNSWLLGYTGIHPEIVLLLKDFINFGIHPIIPAQGSVGVSDLAFLAHLGLALLGHGDVLFQGVTLKAIVAIHKAGLQVATLCPKDGLSIVSANSYSSGKGAILLADIIDFLDTADMIYSLSLEGFHANMNTLDRSLEKTKSFPGQHLSIENVRSYLRGSYLWNTDKLKAIQDPLSFRSACHIHGSVRDAVMSVVEYLHIQLQSSDDNPVVMIEEKRIQGSANFEVTNWVLGFEMIGIAFSHLSKSSCFRSIKLGMPSFTKLTRFLSPKDSIYHGFGTIQKTFSSLDAEIRHLANPISSDYISIAADMEDHATNAPYVIQKTTKMLDNLYKILAIEALHAAQAIDLRNGIRLGVGTQKIYEIIRSEVPFLDRDRNLSIDIHKIYNLLKSGQLKAEFENKQQEQRSSFPLYQRQKGEEFINEVY